MKENKNIDVIIYTFSKRDPAYAASKYHISKLGRLGLFYNEKQICVTDCNSIKERTIVGNDLSLDEVIV